MMRSLFSGVAGLRTHQTKMDVIGNNIANVNTTGYKSQSVTFRDLMYQTTQAASGANAETGLGGINARQIGLGVTTAAINTAIAQQGSAQTTNNPFDIMISGDNFFVVSNGSENLFTRDGSFYVDGAGNLAMTSTGYRVMGWQVDPATGAPKKDTVSALKVMEDSIMTYPPDGTSEGRVTGIVDRNDKNVHTTSGRIMNFEFYDNAGYLYTARFSIHATSTNGRYYIALDDIRDSTGASVGADVLGRTNFGSTMEVETSINYTPLNGTSAASLAGDIEFKDAAGTALGKQAINTEITVDATMDDFLEKVYGIKGNSTATPPIGKIKIDAEGGLSVLQPADAKTTFYAPIAGVDSEVTNKVLTVSHADGTSVQLTPGGPYVPDAGAPAPSIADLAKYYGLNVTDEKVKEIMVNDNGSITVTKKDVDKAAYLEFDPGTGKFVSVGGSGEGLITLGLSGANGTSFKDINLNFSTCSNVNNNGSSTISSAKGDSDGLGSEIGRASCRERVLAGV